jgi:hypothetical protein
MKRRGGDSCVPEQQEIMKKIRLTPIGLSKLFAIFATSPIQLATDIEESE